MGFTRFVDEGGMNFEETGLLAEGGARLIGGGGPAGPSGISSGPRAAVIEGASAFSAVELVFAEAFGVETIKVWKPGLGVGAGAALGGAAVRTGCATGAAGGAAIGPLNGTSQA